MFSIARNLLLVYVVLLSALSISIEAPLSAQAPTAITTVSAEGANGVGLLQAGDGNFYSPSTPFFEACQTDSTKLCAYIFQISDAGVITPFHTFQPIATNLGPTAPNLDGIWPTALIVGTDGNLYGSCRYGGPLGSGTIFQITLGGAFKVLASFGEGITTTPGYSPIAMVEATDGNFYFTNGIGIYRMTPAGVVSTVYTFPFDVNTGFSAKGNSASSLVQGSDGYLYVTMTTPPGIDGGSIGGDSGAIDQISLDGTVVNVIYSFPTDGSLGNIPQGPLVQGPDGFLYGTTARSGNTTKPGMAFKVSPGGAFSLLHAFTGSADGNHPNGALFFASDGNLYGTTLLGGDIGSANCTPIGCGTTFQLTPAGALTTLHTFEGGIPTSLGGPPNAVVDGASPESPLVQVEGGLFNGNTAGNGKSVADFYLMAVSPPLEPPIEVTFNPSAVGINSTATLTWTVRNAFSKTAQLCGAYIQGGATGGGTWAGPQTGAPVNGVYTGTATIKPTQPGDYIYALVCGGKEMGSGGLTVAEDLTITSAALPIALVNKPYYGGPTAAGGTEPYTWTASGLPAGLTMKATSGLVTGTPIQFGNYPVSVTVTDDTTPKNQVTATVTLSVLSGLIVKTSAAVKGTVGARYSQSLDATGGLPPYAWSITGGTLPDGLVLNSGVIVGVPTTVGSSQVTFQVSDSESTPATQSVTLNFDIFGSIQIAAVEFTQVIQQFQLLDELKTSLTTNGEPPVPIVSGKRAVMRVYFTSVDQAKTVIFNASGDVAGQKQFDVPPGCEPADQRSHALPKQCPSVDIYFIPPSGTFSTTLTLSDAGGGELEQEILNVTSRDALAINLKGVWVCTTPTQPSSCQDPSSLLTLKALAEKILPTNSVTVDITTQRISEDVTQYSPEAWVDAVVHRLIEQYTPQNLLEEH